MKTVSSILAVLVALVAMLALVRFTEAVCAAQASFDACLKLQNSNLAPCGFTDWVCQCPVEKAILACYDECKDDVLTQQQGAIQQQRVVNVCTAANTTILQSSLARSSASVASVASVRATAVGPITTSKDTGSLATSASGSASASGTPMPNAASTKQLASGVFAVGIAALAAALAL
ncbi:hypothetical protein BC938DRAFT_471607 [Jimgerdemannia flammicorona]|uniref:Extracellular membrane protein CFEM domain-containing protein n=1 Tax=Jimgerdemannia flammicorona TaxID=994334 RepID=A0A433Q7R8_9FUNG|nr:hypothetical protein BC938DRAFT_471607 [Jimgerdemannia flammicorona]